MRFPISNGMKPENKIVSFFHAIFVNRHHFGLSQKIEEIVKKMSYAEKVFFYAAAAIAAISGIALLLYVNNLFMVEVPALGGKFTEGMIGNPRFINPVLAISDTDKDLVSLVYSGLLKKSENGVRADLAESYEISDDGTVYDVKIKDNAYFHDGKKVTADDVIFTIEKVLNPIIKSPQQANWEGVSVEKISDKEIRFTLKKPFSPFLNVLTMGILPKHIWESVSPEEFPFSEFNIDPIGSGPYKVDKITKNSGDIPTAISFASWSKYALGRPKVKTIAVKFFQNEADLLKAYKNKEIDSTANLSPASIKELSLSEDEAGESSLPRVFGVFLNQSAAPVFLNSEIREALDMSAPKKRIVNEVLFGLGKPLDGPTPANIEPEDAEEGVEAAKALLLKNGWIENENGILEKKAKAGNVVFSFSISTSDSPELKKIAEILQETWSKLGAEVTIKIFESGDLSQNIIKPRKYDALLFGEVVGEDSDLYPFWHSSERNDPGLNVSLYTNITVDKALEETREQTDNQIKSLEKEIIFSEIKKDVPAIFLFSPDFAYIKAPNVKNVTFNSVSSLNERFLFVNDWFIETNKVWKIFTEK